MELIIYFVFRVLFGCIFPSSQKEGRKRQVHNRTLYSTVQSSIIVRQHHNMSHYALCPFD